MSADRLEIRIAGPPDLGAVVALDAEAFGVDAYPHAAIRQLYDLAPNLLLLARRDGGLLGYAIGGVAARRDLGWVLALAVARSARRSGVGFALLAELLARLGDERVGTARVCVHPENGAAIALYSQAGFATQRVEPEYFGVGAPRCVMERPV